MTAKRPNRAGYRLMLLACAALALGLLPTTLYAQDTSLVPIAMVRSSATRNGITVTIAVQKSAVSGEPVVLRIRVSNQSKTPILLDRDDEYPRYDITAKKDQDFKYDVAKIGFGLDNFNQDPRRTRLHTALSVLAPGKSSLVVINLARCFDLSEESTVQVTVTVPYKQILTRPISVPGSTLSQAITAPPVVFELDTPADDSTFGRNKQNLGEPFP